MKIGDVVLKNNLSLGPMAGVTDLSFRLLCKEQEVGLVYTEMISAKGLVYNDQNTKKLIEIHDKEKPVALQIFGSDPEFMARAAEKLNDHDHAMLDINMGCPTPKIVRNGDGSALMKNPKLAGEVVRAVVNHTDKPVTVKIRKGWDDDHINAVEMAKRIEENGAKAIAVHGRTREQFYTGKADWNIIKEVKNSVSIPVIGNGDVLSIEDALKMKKMTNCDGIMIARGAQGNPWIFRRISHYMKTGEILAEPTIEEKINMMMKHLYLFIEYKGEYVAVREMRKHIGWYLKGVRNSSIIRGKLNTLQTKEDIKEMLQKILEYSV
ncbi:tRNA dihydrouridine synthase DusB [Anaerophilus nitritogenes]|uniref:tRNA dihydrouridine synthase DusB n=1 Tax=Anaerophilus nitritogenes TaxID=2498136 RepID=UPI00101DE13D|nr:tRNA dihydrouridine synthase DusB [Anaerophilus nitritogenes]